MASTDILDTHICGLCKVEFSDIYKFLDHKKICLTKCSAQIPGQVAKSRCTASLNENFSRVMVSAGGRAVKDGFDTITKSQTISVCNKAGFSALSTNISNSLSGTLSDDSDISLPVKTGESDSKETVSLRSKNADRVSTDGIAVFVVSPNSFASSIENLDAEEHNEKRNEQATLSDKLKRDKSNQILEIKKGLHSGSADDLFTDNYQTSGSDTSTLCPEDLEVGQISASIIGQQEQKLHLEEDHNKSGRTLGTTICIESSLHDSTTDSPVSAKNTHMNTAVASSSQDRPALLSYIRRNTASAPTVVGCGKIIHKRRVSLEKRERLQGFSEELLADTEKSVVAASQQPSCGDSGDHNEPGSLKPSPPKAASSLKSFKAIFTSPSRSGHRLSPTHGDSLNQLVKNSQQAVEKSSQNILSYSGAKTYKDISAAACFQKSSQVPNLAPKVFSKNSQNLSKRNKTGTERQISFDITRDPQQSQKWFPDDFKLLLKASNSALQRDVAANSSLRNVLLSGDVSHSESSLGTVTSSTSKSAQSFSCPQTKLLLSTQQFGTQPTLASGSDKTSHSNKPRLLPAGNLPHHAMSFNSQTSSQCPQNDNTLASTSSEDDLHKAKRVIVKVDTETKEYRNGDGSVIFVPKNHHQSVNISASPRLPNQTLTFQAQSNELHQPAGASLAGQTKEQIKLQVLPSSQSVVQHPQQREQQQIMTAQSLQAQTVLYKQITETAQWSQTYDSTNCAEISTGEWAVQPQAILVNRLDNYHHENAAPIMLLAQTTPAKSMSASTDHAVQVQPSCSQPLSSVTVNDVTYHLAQAQTPVIATPKEPCIIRRKRKTQKSSSSTQAIKADVTKAQVKDSDPDNKEQRLFTCKFDKCRYTSSLYKDFQRHYRIHTGEKPFRCNQCGKAFNRSDKLRIHLRWHEGAKPYQCPLCDYKTLESGSLRKHVRIHSDERPYKCQICPYASRNSSHLTVHLRTHTGDSPFLCSECGAKFKINSDLKRHMRTHTGEKPYKCDHCDYRSTNNGNLKTHIRINHSKGNEIQCSQCEFSTSSRRRLREHSKSHHATAEGATDRGSGVFSCQQCTFRCSDAKQLRAHLCTHDTVKPYQCSFCPFATKQSGNLRKHVQSLHVDKLQRPSQPQGHSGKRQPSKRGKNARMSPKLHSMRTKQGRSSSYMKPHKCPKCDCEFVRLDSLRSHLNQHNQTEKKIHLASTKDQTAVPSAVSSQVFTQSTKGKASTSNTQHITVSQPYQSTKPNMQQIAKAAAAKLFEENFAQAGSNVGGALSFNNQGSGLSKSKMDSTDLQASATTLVMLQGAVDVHHPPSLANDYQVNQSNKSSLRDILTKSDVDLKTELSTLKEADSVRQLPWEHSSYTMSLQQDSPSNTSVNRPHMLPRVSVCDAKVQTQYARPISDYQIRDQEGSLSAAGQARNRYGLEDKSIVSQGYGDKAKRMKMDETSMSLHPASDMCLSQQYQEQQLQKLQHLDYQQQHQYYVSDSQHPQTILHQAQTTSNNTVFDLSAADCQENTLILTQQVEDGSSMEQTLNLQLVPHTSLQQPAPTQLVTQAPGQPETHIQIVLPDLSNSEGMSLLGQQQLVLQVQDDQLEVVSVPYNQIVPGQMTRRPQGTKVFQDFGTNTATAFSGHQFGSAHAIQLIENNSRCSTNVSGNLESSGERSVPILPVMYSEATDSTNHRQVVIVELKGSAGEAHLEED